MGRTGSARDRVPPARSARAALSTAPDRKHGREPAAFTAGPGGNPASRTWPVFGLRALAGGKPRRVAGALARPRVAAWSRYAVAGVGRRGILLSEQLDASLVALEHLHLRPRAVARLP